MSTRLVSALRPASAQEASSSFRKSASGAGYDSSAVRVIRTSGNFINTLVRQVLSQKCDEGIHSPRLSKVGTRVGHIL